MSDDNEVTNDHNVTSNNSINDLPKKAPPPATEQKILTGVSALLPVAGDIHLWRMRWFALVILALGFLGAIAACIVTKSPFPLAIGIIMRPTIRWLFPSDPHGKSGIP